MNVCVQRVKYAHKKWKRLAIERMISASYFLRLITQLASFLHATPYATAIRKCVTVASARWFSKIYFLNIQMYTNEFNSFSPLFSIQDFNYNYWKITNSSLLFSFFTTFIFAKIIRYLYVSRKLIISLVQ